MTYGDDAGNAVARAHGEDPDELSWKDDDDDSACDDFGADDDAADEDF